jgi:hypothetical protein
MKALIALFAATLVTTAVADDKPKEESMRTTEAKFDKLDRDDDNRVSKTEAQQDDTLAAQFASIDQNADGFVTKSEYTAQLDTKERRPY